MNDRQTWETLGRQLRIDSIRASSAAGSGHPTSSMSAADLMSVLLERHLRYDFAAPEDPHNDHLVFSKGHASPLLYSMYRAAGAIDDAALLSYRRRGSPFEGHPTPVLPWVDVATGSLGQGLPIAVGIALAGKRLDRLPYRVWVLTGDGELAEGSMWEAFEHAAVAGLDNLTAILDINRLGQTRETMHGWDLSSYTGRLSALGWHAIEIDGHDVDAISAAYAEAGATTGRPTAIVARTVKGSGVSAVADRNGMHGKPLGDLDAALAELGAATHQRITVAVHRPDVTAPAHGFEARSLELPRYDIGSSEATRRAYAEALLALGRARGDVVALDGDVDNSTYTELFASALPERYFEMYIAEQQMASAAVGLQVRGWIPFASTYGAFWSRAFDFIRMAAVSRANIRISGSHAGVSIGPDGPSQMGLEDIASFRSIWGSTVLYPSDANEAARLVVAMADRSGVVYMRTTRGKTPVIYGADEEFEIGGSRVVRSSPDDAVTLIGAGVTLHEAIKAATSLADSGIAARVIDLYSIKPIDASTLAVAARETGRIVTVEDHRPEGGLGEAVLATLAETDVQPRVGRLAVANMPGSATPEEQLADAGIDAAAIAGAARRLVEG
ncbi:MAG TPA: transketolase [Candidatus Limnocylindrales bacterium]|nr:transketolase [Candidatus Limnocylindrales bacterium]